MNISKIVLASTVVGALVVGISLSNTDLSDANTEYSSNNLVESNKTPASWAGAKEYLDLLHANVYTGIVEPNDYKLAKEHINNMLIPKSVSIDFSEEGPDNVGGRTRAIIVDVNNDDVIYAGSVSGGLFKSTDAGNTWNILTAWRDNVPTTNISSCVMTQNGTLYVGTGLTAFNEQGFQNGEGVWYSTDGGNSFNQVVGTETHNTTKLWAVNDILYYSGDGLFLRKVVNGSSASPTITTMDDANGIDISQSTGADVKVSPDNEHILYCGFNKAFVSNNGGSSFTDLSGTVDFSFVQRIEGAISYTKSNGAYVMYMVLSKYLAGTWGGAWTSLDNGLTWTEIAPEWADSPNIPDGDEFNPLGTAGNYAMVCDADPTNNNRFYFGGENSVYKWEKTPGSDPIAGQFERVSFGLAFQSFQLSPTFIHPDHHRITWDSQGRLFVGSDGGISASIPDAFNTDSSLLFTTLNKGYNVTQFNDVAYGTDGEVMGGSQDNGALYNDHVGRSYQQFREIIGTDAYDVEISQLNSDALIATNYNSGIYLTTDGGLNTQPEFPPCGGSIPGIPSTILGGCNYTEASFFSLFEDMNDLDSQDSIEFFSLVPRFIGDTVVVNSSNFSIPIEHILTQDLVVTYDVVIPLNDSILPNFDTIPAGVPYYYNPQTQDTIKIQDPVQSIVATGNTSGVYLSRGFWRSGDAGFNKIHSTDKSSAFEFSKDGDKLWIGTYDGQLYRVSNLDNAYDIYQMSADSVGFVLDIDTVTVTGLLPTQVITDISVHPDDPNKVAITAGGAGGNNVFYSFDALSASPTFAVKNGNLPSYPVYSCELITDPQDDVTMVLGTEFGVYATGDDLSGVVSWAPATTQTGIVPVYDVRQQWRPWGFNRWEGHDGVKNPGRIYIGTYGRGIWKSDNAASVEHIDPTADDAPLLSNIRVYPNPMRSEGTLQFTINTATDVAIQLYDLQGKRVRQINLKNVTAGNHRIEFNVADFAAGTYLVSFNTKEAREVTKFIKR